MMAMLAAGAMVPAVVHALDPGTVKLPDRVSLAADTPELVLNGAGLRARSLVRIYVAGLYLVARRADPKQVLTDKGPKRISLTLLREQSAPQLHDELSEGIRDNHTPSEIESLRIPLDELSGLVMQLGIAKPGTVVTLDYLPGRGTRMTVNGVARGRPVAGDDLFPALLRIWLGDDPVDRGLRRAMLGQ